MTEPTTPTATPDAPAQETPDTPAKPETDWKAEAKKWEARAKENKTAAEKLAAIEEANKTEAQRAADRLAEAEKRAGEAERLALRFKVASQFSITADDADLFLTGSDEETLTKQAKRLVDRESERKKQGPFVPREGNSPPKTAASDERTFARSLFSGGPSST